MNTRHRPNKRFVVMTAQNSPKVGGDVAKRLTDRQKKKIIADYAERENISRVAEMNKVSRGTVRRIIAAHPDVTEIATEKKRANTRDMLDYMDSVQGEAQRFIGSCLTELLKDGRLEKARVSEITTAMGTVIDKFANLGQLNASALSKLDQLIAGLDDEAER